MKAKSIRSMAGVTLLEIMLVLAIAGVIVLMSVRYYQQSTRSSKQMQTLSLINGITVAAEQYRNANGSYDTKMTAATLAPYMGNVTPVSPYGAVTVAGTGAAYTIKITAGADCTNIAAQLNQSLGSGAAVCTGDGAAAELTVTR